MIIVDTTLLACLHLPNEMQETAEAALMKDPVWAAPRLWRSEFRNVLFQYIKRGLLPMKDAVQQMANAHDLMQANEFEVGSGAILDQLAYASISAYDAEFVALARELDLPLVTADNRLLESCASHAVSMEEFIS